MTKKITVSLPDDLVDAAGRAVRAGQAVSVSAYIADALAAKVARTRAAATLEKIFTDVGQPGPEHDDWARRVLGLDRSTGHAA